MVFRLVLGMAGLAVIETGVVEIGRFPGQSAVAVGALPAEVVNRPVRSVAGLAILAYQAMVEVYVGPAAGGVAASAVSGKVFCWFGRRVTTLTGVRRPGIAPVRMAALAGQGSVLAGKRVEGVHRSDAAWWE